MDLYKDLVAASATPLVLSILEEGDSYGYAIIKRVKELSEEEMNWTDGMLYPVLHRLEKQGYINSYWKESQTGRKRKYYSLTREGSDTLEDIKSQWRLVNKTLSRAWEKGLWIPATGEH
jgi:PadR family transcriptional regulator, regulatory protein PadR